MIATSHTLTRVLVVDDSPFICKALTTVINSDPALRVVGTATNGREAIELVPQLTPDLITMDLSMPEMDGLEATRQIMAYHPTPILIISSTIFDGGTNEVFKAMTLGALDVIQKAPFKTLSGAESEAASLTERIKTLARVKVITHPLAKIQGRCDNIRAIHARRQTNAMRIVAIASSTGGPQALLAILKMLPKDLPCGVLVVQHISEGFDRGLAEWLDAECEVTIKLATDGERIQPGTVYIAPTNVHMLAGEGGTIRFSNEPPIDGQRPSANALFESVAEFYGERAVAVVLTGMGRDGADALRRIRERRGHVIAQDEATSVVFGMPKAAIELGVVDSVRPVDRIASAILSALNHPAKKETRR